MIYKYKFQGQELQDELGLGWYSYKWRNYDTSIARFMSIDPLAEEYEDYTPYQFSSNQPVHAKELEGLESSNDLNKKDKTPTQRAYNKKTGNTDLLKLMVYSASNFLSSINTYREFVLAEISVSLSTTGGGNQNQKTDGKADEHKNVDGLFQAASFAGLPGGKVKNGKTDAVKKGSQTTKNAEYFKEGMDATEKGQEVIELVDNLFGTNISNDSVIVRATVTRDTTVSTKDRKKVEENQKRKENERRVQTQKTLSPQ